MAQYQNNNGSRNNRDPLHFEIIAHLLTLNTKENGWTKEINIVSWNGGPNKLDIREWNPEHTRMTKGMTVFEADAEKLAIELVKRYNIRTDAVNDAPHAASPQAAPGTEPDADLQTETQTEPRTETQAIPRPEASASMQSSAFA